MPWDKENYPVSMKNLKSDVREKAIEIGNALLEEKKMPEGMAIATAISRAKDWAANRGEDIGATATDVKMHGYDQYVVPFEGEWAIKTEMNDHLKTFHYKKDAVKRAREEAKKHNSNVVIQGQDGHIQQKISYNPNKKLKIKK